MSETIEPPVIDKSTWGPGAWQDEPDRVDFVAHGLACFVLRHFSAGSWCGYVGVPREHPWYGMDWTAPGSKTRELDAHMGINYSQPCAGQICHVPAPGMPDDVWWFGFDCDHLFDLAPGRLARNRRIHAEMGSPVDGPFREIDMREVYRPLPYVRAEAEHLAEQLAAITRPER